MEIVDSLPSMATRSVKTPSPHAPPGAYPAFGIVALMTRSGATSTTSISAGRRTMRPHTSLKGAKV